MILNKENCHIFILFTYFGVRAGRSVEDRHLRKVEATGSNPVQSIKKISNESLEEYLSFLELKGVTKGHKKEIDILSISLLLKK